MFYRAVALLFFAVALRADPQAAISIFSRQCVSCHGAAKLSGLDLRSRDALLQGGTRGAAVIPGNSTGSLLIKALRGDGLPKMPPGKQALPESEIASVAAWIDAGAAFETSNRPLATAPAWWSLRKPIRPPLPNAEPNPVDAFLRATLAAKRSSPFRSLHPERWCAGPSSTCTVFRRNRKRWTSSSPTTLPTLGRS